MQMSLIWVMDSDGFRWLWELQRKGTTVYVQGTNAAVMFQLLLHCRLVVSRGVLFKIALGCTVVAISGHWFPA